jgi:rhamnopyranosyl-N-acetylglucosaminyl-diphospho-decaprenol beta-1,3/1,4-galactofuranosyltransferase
MKVVAVIVTNNRLELLKEAIAAVESQTFQPTSVIVVNNASTDGTAEWLNQQPGLITIHQENLGGSGGFHTGIKEAINKGAKWIWVMDDDTIPYPETLERLIEKTGITTENVGFIGSKCIWKDGAPHLMNIPAIKPGFNERVPFNKYDDSGLLLIETCSFVSLLINAEAVKQVGLPYKEFFIWGDDQEFTRRITKAGYVGLYCANSKALHKTGINYFPDFYRDTVNNLWKHRYGFRNEFFMVKKNKSFLYYIFWLIAKVFFTSYKIIRIRKDNRFRFIRVLFDSAWKSIFFRPRIEMVNSVNTPKPSSLHHYP